MLALTGEWALTQAVDPGHDGPDVAAFGQFDADGFFDDLALGDGSLELVIDFSQWPT